MSETIPIASDHAGVEMKNRLVAELKKMGYTPDDFGSNDPSKPDDYPDFGHPRAQEVDDQGVETMKAWLDTKFEGGRHERRIEKIELKDI